MIVGRNGKVKTTINCSGIDILKINEHSKKKPEEIKHKAWE